MAKKFRDLVKTMSRERQEMVAAGTQQIVEGDGLQGLRGMTLLGPLDVNRYKLTVVEGLLGAIWVYRDDLAILCSSDPPKGETERQLVIYYMDRPDWCTEDMGWSEVICRLFDGVPQDPVWRDVERLLRAS